ncbi:hypothetical protein Ccrd_020908 [Cynara cardunculus var. scolymus]|uniref:Uncharacterized protein n=1 Tax=Cynara cardunculus var. scolymus TaxID=59895 RepID=A0A103Y1J9_CYNCS|nr:hypothetical protein Ccrd_020908 [Cynara cardunculus var. scolymus]
MIMIPIAAFIAEPVMGAGWVIPPPVGYFEKVKFLYLHISAYCYHSRFLDRSNSRNKNDCNSRHAIHFLPVCDWLGVAYTIASVQTDLFLFNVQKYVQENTFQRVSMVELSDYQRRKSTVAVKLNVNRLYQILNLEPVMGAEPPPVGYFEKVEFLYLRISAYCYHSRFLDRSNSRNKNDCNSRCDSSPRKY